MPEMKFICSNCGVEIEADESFAGSVAQCPSCNSTVMIPMQGIRPGMKVAGFEIIRKLGAGGMGEVWLATQTAMDRKVALKILSPALTSNKDFVARFLKEVKTAAKLEHPNIVTAFDAGVDGDIYYLAMSYIDGVLLDNRLTIDKRISEKDALKIVRCIADALCYAWNDFRILHRDIKPANIMIDSRKMPKLMDMGISKSLSEEKSLTMTGMIVGTPYYMSPEQARADSDIDCRSDIYSLGVTLYHLVTGEVPYDATTAMGILLKHVSEPFPPPRGKNPELSMECAVLLEIMMAKSPADRQKNWEDAIRDIDLVLSGLLPAAARPSAGSSTVLQETPSQKISRKKVLEKLHRPARVPEKASLVPRQAPPQEKKERNWFLSPLLIAIVVTICVLIICGVVILFSGKKVKPPQIAVQTGTATPAAPLDDTMVEEMIKKAIEELKKKNPDQKELKASFDKGRRNLELKDNQELTDVSPLKGLPLASLSLQNCTKVTDISALKGMPLVWLNLISTQVADISALKGMSLVWLNLQYTKVTDISTLKGMPLSALALESPISEINTLKGMPLTHLTLTGQLTDISALEDMPRLANLDLGALKVTDISVLKSIPLECLDLFRCTSLNDLSPLADCKKLKKLSIPEQCKNIKFLRNLPNLEILDTKWTRTSKRTPTEFWRDFDAKK